MNRWRTGRVVNWLVLWSGVLASPGLAARAQDREIRKETVAKADSNPEASDGRRGRGAYLVHDVAMCVQCHSPRDAKGELVASRLLTGSPIPVKYVGAGQRWAASAPRLAGLPGWTQAQIVTLLVTGRREDGTSPRPPMPPFRIRSEDAEAIADYLRRFEP